MPYPKHRDLGLPIGSGAVESALRDVVSLRLRRRASTGARTVSKRCWCCLPPTSQGA